MKEIYLTNEVLMEVEKKLLSFSDFQRPNMQTTVKNVFYSGNGNSKNRFHSTVHPVVLPATINELLILLKGLESQDSIPPQKESARRPANKIWVQLSPYGKELIKKQYTHYSVSEEYYRWLKSIPETQTKSDLYHTDDENLSHDFNKDYVLLYKSGEVGSYLIKTENGREEWLNNVRITMILGNQITFTDTDGLKKNLPETGHYQIFKKNRKSGVILPFGNDVSYLSLFFRL